MYFSPNWQNLTCCDFVSSKMMLFRRHGLDDRVISYARAFKMIESCSKKRMIFAIAVLAGLSLLVIILESSQLRSNNEDFQDIHDTHPVLKEKLKDKDKCWLKETYEVTEECDVCSPEEVSDHNPVVCAVAKSELLTMCQTSSLNFYCFQITRRR